MGAAMETPMRRLRILLLLPLFAVLSGCAVYPAPGYYAPPAASVYVAPRPYYYGPHYYRPYYGWGWRRW
ncbi:MAG: hypothetical protein IRY87_17755 [Acetobacteraceae bacterium]|nr:hypothetical protein [Acetobacteraceae bacterium]